MINVVTNPFRLLIHIMTETVNIMVIIGVTHQPYRHYSAKAKAKKLKF